MEQNDVIVTIVEKICDNILPITIFLGIFIEIVPIKIKPISWLMDKFFKPIRDEMTKMEDKISKDIDAVKEELKSEIDQLRSQQMQEKTQIDKLLESLEMTEISRLRWEIMEFANSLKNNQLHTRNEYLHIKDDNRKYHALIDKYGLTNGIIDDAVEQIDNHYEQNKNSTSVYF